MGTTLPIMYVNDYQLGLISRSRCYKCSKAILSLRTEDMFIFSAESLLQHPVQCPDVQHPHHRHHQAHRPTLRRSGASRSQQAGVPRSEAGARLHRQYFREYETRRPRQLISS